jgi:hypothetical protein
MSIDTLFPFATCAAASIIFTLTGGEPLLGSPSDDDCPASIVHFENPLPTMPPSLKGLEGVPWVAGRPASSRMLAYLFYYHPDPAATDLRSVLYANGVTPQGGYTKILWIFLRRNRSHSIGIHGYERRTGATFVQRVRGAGLYVPSIVDVPSAGCWDLRVRTATPPKHRTSATFTFIVR